MEGNKYFVCTFLSSLSAILSFSNNKAESLCTPWKRGSINKSKYGFDARIDAFDLYLFQLIVLLKSDFNCYNSFVLFWVDKVTTGS